MADTWQETKKNKFNPNQDFFLQFPENDEETNSVYEATVSFRPIEVEGDDIASFLPSVDAVKEGFSEGIRDAGSWALDKGAQGLEAVGEGLGNLGNAIGNRLGFGGDGPDPSELNPETDEVRVPPTLDANPDLETETEVQTVIRRNADPIPLNNRTVELYLPQAFQLNEGVEFDTSLDIGAIGVQVQQGLSDTTGMMNALAKAATNTGGLIDGLRSNAGGEVAKLLGTRMAQASSREIGGAVALATRVATNPNTRALFKNVQTRVFNFSFTLVPNSPKEAETIENIIAFFRTELYPEEIGFQGIPMGYRFPNLIEIRLRNRGSNIITRILPSYLVDMQTTYNTQSMSMHRGPNPNAEFSDVQLVLNFREYRPMNKQDVLYEYGFETEDQELAWLNNRANINEQGEEVITRDVLDNR